MTTLIDVILREKFVLFNFLVQARFYSCHIYIELYTCLHRKRNYKIYLLYIRTLCAGINQHTYEHTNILLDI